MSERKGKRGQTALVSDASRSTGQGDRRRPKEGTSLFDQIQEDPAADQQSDGQPSLCILAASLREVKGGLIRLSFVRPLLVDRRLRTYERALAHPPSSHAGLVLRTHSLILCMLSPRPPCRMPLKGCLSYVREGVFCCRRGRGNLIQILDSSSSAQDLPCPSSTDRPLSPYPTTMAPTSIYRRPGAQHFQLVHRSQRDPLINDPEASGRVLKQVEVGQVNKVRLQSWSLEGCLRLISEAEADLSLCVACRALSLCLGRGDRARIGPPPRMSTTPTLVRPTAARPPSGVSCSTTLSTTTCSISVRSAFRQDQATSRVS